MWIEDLKAELSCFDENIPIFITSQYLILLLTTEHKYIRKASELYSKNTVILAEENKLKRTIIPLFRHYLYSLDKHPEYVNYIKNII